MLSHDVVIQSFINNDELVFACGKFFKTEKVVPLERVKQHIVLNMSISRLSDVVHSCEQFSGLLRCFYINCLKLSICKVFNSRYHIVSIDMILTCVLSLRRINPWSFDTTVC